MQPPPLLCVPPCLAQVLCTGDLFIWATPNCGNPQKVQRYPVQWAAALRAMADKGTVGVLAGGCATAQRVVVCVACVGLPFAGRLLVACPRFPRGPSELSTRWWARPQGCRWANRRAGARCECRRGDASARARPAHIWRRECAGCAHGDGCVAAACGGRARGPGVWAACIVARPTPPPALSPRPHRAREHEDTQLCAPTSRSPHERLFAHTRSPRLPFPHPLPLGAPTAAFLEDIIAQTMKGINAGASLNDIVTRLVLPEGLMRRPYLVRVTGFDCCGGTLGSGGA